MTWDEAKTQIEAMGYRDVSLDPVGANLAVHAVWGTALRRIAIRCPNGPDFAALVDWARECRASEKSIRN